jgi:hypothetical protein
MQRTQTGYAVKCAETGKTKNCSSYAEYETPTSSATANLCNGGWYKGEFYNECASKAECMVSTLRKTGGYTVDQRRHLPIHTNEAKPFGSRPGSTIVGGTPNLADHLRGWGTWPTTIPKADTMMRPGVPLPSPMQVPAPLPFPVQPPPEWPEAMRTAYAGPTPVQAGGVTPTFLPKDDEPVWSRLGKNIVQGWIGSTGWHTYDYARTVDLFGRR